MKICRWHWWIIIIFLFFLGFVPSYRGDIANILEKTGLRQAPATEEKTLSLEIIDLYLECRHIVTRQREITEDALPEFLREINKNRVISGYTGEELVLTGEIPGLCPVCQEKEFIGIYQGYIAVYAGRPDRPGPVKKMTSIKIQGLPEREIIDLEAGIIFNGEEEKLLILEAYSEEQTTNNKPEE